MSDLLAVLKAATDQEDPFIREAARRAGLLWQCPCGFDNPADQPTCDGCGTRVEDVCGRSACGPARGPLF